MLMDGSLINRGLRQGVTVAAVSHLKVLVAPQYCAELEMELVLAIWLCAFLITK